MHTTLPQDSSASKVFNVTSYEPNLAGVQLVSPPETPAGTTSWPLPQIPSNLSLNSTAFRINPYETRKWTDRDERDFTDLAFKVAGYQTSPDEDLRFKQMVTARRRDIPQRSAEQIMLTAEHDQLLLEMKEVLQKYHAFRIKLGPYHHDHKALGNSSKTKSSG